MAGAGAMSRWAVMAALLLAALSTNASADQKPYEPVRARFDLASNDDAALRDLIERLRKAAADRDMPAINASLTKSFTVVACKTDPTLPCAPGKKGVKQPAAKLSPAERLAQGLCCADTPRAQITKDMIADAITGQLAAALDAAAIGAHPDAAGVACLPAWPLFDRPRAARMARAAGVEAASLRVADGDVQIRLKPDAKQPVAETLPKGSLVALVADLDVLIPDGWSAIALPKGGLGYTDALGLNDLAPSGLCFVREGPIWKTGFFILREE